MSKWYYKVTEDISNIPLCIDHFEKELSESKIELSLKGKTIERHSSELPGILESRFSQLQEIEAILEYLNIQLTKKRSAVFKKYLEHYNKVLSSRDCEKYVDGEPEIVDYTLLVNEFALIRNKYLGIMKGLDCKQYQLGHLTRLKVAGMEDFSIK